MKTLKLKSAVWRTNSKTRGFTLLETVIALTVITAAVVGPFSLATRGILVSSLSKNKIIAVNLAQEGIELVRLIRDNNILANRTWDSGINLGTWQTDVCTFSLTPGSLPLRFDSTTGLYCQTTGNETIFTRTVTITKPTADQILIAARVSWSERGIPRQINLQETLYNWK